MSECRIHVLGVAVLGVLGACRDTGPIQSQITALASHVDQAKGELAASRRAIQGADAESHEAVNTSVVALSLDAAAVEAAGRARQTSRSTTDALDREERRSLAGQCVDAQRAPRLSGGVSEGVSSCSRSGSSSSSRASMSTRSP
jgi:hypothetical protein